MRKGFNSSLNLSMTDEERQPTYRHSMEWTDVQEQLSKDLLNLSISVKSSQQNMVNRILSNSNYAPEWWILENILYIIKNIWFLPARF